MKDRKPIDLLLAVGSRLIQLPMPVAFVGGATTGLLVTDPAAPAPRSTLDVDVIVEVSSYADYTSVLVPVLRSLAAREDVSEGAPLCRWILNIEDLVAVLDGRPELHDEVGHAPATLRSFVADTLELWLAGDELLDALPGHLPGNIDNHGRARLIADRLRALISLR